MEQKYRPNDSRVEEDVDKLDLAFFLLRRNGKIIIGLILLVCFGLWIYNASITGRKPKSAGAWSKTLDEYLPVTNIDAEPTVKESTDSKERKKTVSEIKEENSNRILKVTQFLASATTEEKVDEALDLRESWMKVELPFAYILVWRRAKISRNLIEADVDDKTRLFAYTEYIESILTLDALNCQGGLSVPGIREAMLEVGTMFSEFPDDGIKSKASLAYVLEPAHDYIQTKDLDNLDQIAVRFEEHGSKIVLDPSNAIRFVKLLADLYARSNYSSKFKPAGLRIAKKMRESKDEEILETATRLKEQMFFAKMGLPSLVSRIEGGNLEARNNVQEFFESLAVNQSSRIEIYQIAIDVVAQYKNLGSKEDAAALAQWLQKINSENQVEENRLKIDKALVELLK